MMEINVEIGTDKVCRACMKEASNMSYLFNKDADTHLGKILSFITNMTVREDDKLPKHLCSDCVTIMNQAESFKRLCLETESKFKLLLQTLNVVDSQYLETIEKPQIKHENYDAGNPCLLPYQCSYCAVKFGDIGDLVSHVATHEGVGNKSCIEAESLTDRKDDIFNAGSDAVRTIKNNVKEVKEEFEDVSELDDNLFSNDFDSNVFVDLRIKAKKKKKKTGHRCLECSSLFERRKELLNHERNIHGKRKVKKELESIDNICEDDKSISQLLKEAKESQHTCFICNLNCASKSALLKHQRNKHPGKLKDLIRDLLTRDEQQPHQIKDKPEPKHKCSHCMRKFVKKTTLTAHLKRHSNPSSSHTCSICKREFMHRAHLDNHILKVHTSTNGLKCDFCPVSFASQDSLDVHKATHESDKRHKCQVCSKSFNMLSTLRDHLRTHTGEKPFLCPMCGKGFSQNTNLMEHLRRHQGIKPFKCEMCERRFVSKGELAAHHRKHSGAHPFVCDDCGNGFTTSSSLVKHRRTHTGERPYACDLCPMRFAASGTLKNHRRTHTGEKPHKCVHCEKAFVQKNDLVSHTRCHTGERPYVCSTCGQSFRQGSALKTHLKMHSVKDLHSIVYSAKDVEIRDY